MKKYTFMAWGKSASLVLPCRSAKGARERRRSCAVGGPAAKRQIFVDLFSWVRTGLICLFRVGNGIMDIVCHIYIILLLLCVRDCIHANFSSVHPVPSCVGVIWVA